MRAYTSQGLFSINRAMEFFSDIVNLIISRRWWKETIKSQRFGNIFSLDLEAENAKSRPDLLRMTPVKIFFTVLFKTH